MSRKSLTPKPIGFNVTSDGDISPYIGKHMRTEIAVVYHMNGGTEWFAEWARKNPGEYFTKILPRIVTKEVEVTASEGVEDLLKRLDSDTLDGTFTEVDLRESDDI